MLQLVTANIEEIKVFLITERKITIKYWHDKFETLTGSLAFNLIMKCYIYVVSSMQFSITSSAS